VEQTVARSKSAGVVVAHQILRVGPEGLVTRIEKIMICVVHECRRYRDLKLRTMVADAQHRLRDVVQNGEIPRVGRRLRHPLRNTLQAGVRRLKVSKSRSRRWIQREELIIPLCRLERCGHGDFEGFDLRDADLGNRSNRKRQRRRTADAAIAGGHVQRIGCRRSRRGGEGEAAAIRRSGRLDGRRRACR
jgi:hypothetical protein